MELMAPPYQGCSSSGDESRRRRHPAKAAKQKQAARSDILLPQQQSWHLSGVGTFNPLAAWEVLVGPPIDNNRDRAEKWPGLGTSAISAVAYQRHSPPGCGPRESQNRRLIRCTSWWGGGLSGWLVNQALSVLVGFCGVKT